jgi:SAM-dependent methyltransferase
MARVDPLGEPGRHGARDRDYDLYAKFYLRRVAYAPRFFAVLAKRLGLSKESFALDLACGTGQVALGLAPYCGSVVAIDRSMNMLSMRRAAPENVRFVKADLHSPRLRISRPADLVTIGRALHYLKREAVLPLLAAATKPSASIVVCNTQFHADTPWAAKYMRLLDSYIERLKFEGYYGRHFFADTEWLRMERPGAVGLMRFSVPDLVQHTLSHPHYADVFLTRERELEERLRALLKPYFVAEDQVEAKILSDGVVYRRAPGREN